MFNVFEFRIVLLLFSAMDTLIQARQTGLVLLSDERYLHIMNRFSTERLGARNALLTNIRCNSKSNIATDEKLVIPASISLKHCLLKYCMIRPILL